MKGHKALHNVTLKGLQGPSGGYLIWAWRPKSSAINDLGKS